MSAGESGSSPAPFQESFGQNADITCSSSFRKAIESVEAEMRAKERASTPHIASTLKDQEIGSLDEVTKVSVQDIVKVTSATMGSLMLRKILDLPVHHKLVLCTLSLLQKSGVKDIIYSQV